jgi:pre-mRNA-processing factor 40
VGYFGTVAAGGSGLFDLTQSRVRESRTRGMQKLVHVFKSLHVDALSRWRDTQKALTTSQAWNEDPEIRELADLDVLLAFEDYSRVLERTYDEHYRRADMERTMKVRKAREGFKVRPLCC